jgi:hypothetical protein
MSRTNRQARIYRQRVSKIKAELGCQRCGENDPVCLDFHHIDELNKAFKISWGVSTALPWEDILYEIDKCDVLCANCHRKEHGG